MAFLSLPLSVLLFLSSFDSISFLFWRRTRAKDLFGRRRPSKEEEERGISRPSHSFPHIFFLAARKSPFCRMSYFISL